MTLVFFFTLHFIHRKAKSKVMRSVANTNVPKLDNDSYSCDLLYPAYNF